MSDRVPLLLDRIRAAVARDPDAMAFVGRDMITYGGMRALVGSAMRMLDSRGIRTGQVVAITMSQSPLHVIVYLALARLGAISISVTPIANDAARAALYRRFGVTAVVSELENAGAPGVMLVHLRSLPAHRDDPLMDEWPYEPVASTPLRIALTSGTVGEQKGFELTHGDVALRIDRRMLGGDEAPRLLPQNLHMTGSISLAGVTLSRGGAIVFPPGYDSQSLFVAIREHRVSLIAIPPAHAAAMLSPLKGDTPAFPSLTHLRLIGGTPSPALVEEIRRKMTPHVIFTYSTGEAGVISIATPEIMAEAPGSSGRIAPGVTLEIVDAQDRALPAGEIGEIRVKGPAMARGYLGGVDADRFRDGWFYPRDSGYLTKDGLLYVQGRVDEILNVGGRKLTPNYAESILESHPSVGEAAVFPLDGMSLGAIVVPKAPVDWPNLDAFARLRLDVMAPRRYYEAERLPRNDLGKIRRPDLAALVAGDGATLRHPSK